MANYDLFLNPTWLAKYPVENEPVHVVNLLSSSLGGRKARCRFSDPINCLV